MAADLRTLRKGGPVLREGRCKVTPVLEMDTWATP